MSPKEHELKRQVNDLFERGLIRETMSPCVVPALLVPKNNGSWCMYVDSRAIKKLQLSIYFPFLD